MNVYKVPFSFTHEEKVFGGYLSLRQMLYLVLIIISLGIFFIPYLPFIIKILMFLTISSTLLIFAFVKAGGIYADKYFLNILKFIIRKKIYLYER